MTLPEIKERAAHNKARYISKEPGLPRVRAYKAQHDLWALIQLVEEAAPFVEYAEGGACSCDDLDNGCEGCRNTPLSEYNRLKWLDKVEGDD